MAAAMKECKVCGCKYEYCHTAKRITGIFRWQDVACSPEHGSIYLAQVVAARAGKTLTVLEKSSPDVEITDEIDDEYDELFEEDFDDTDEEATVITAL